ncbi:hypothetical protein BU24DRAFT_428922 [Aaosphaeria arxii CBS 175.79]|uniref:RING-type domain-containing protein n=1 Tax=Aaosphaeria arxii CBS 175.79 TaxID=1450172 RepID=A0A6A5X7P7_9PLEO|nr:uncharacterized protein BU24DRAFT_428922 [Aaosphaeria arxii CBS 175.79]KAF2008941.1 hypothetical protein BU24DRAFT_428922 [Aaosphaeria arxii CBS 175.79]
MSSWMRKDQFVRSLTVPEEDCGICLQPYEIVSDGHFPVRLPCGHWFGRRCIISSIERSTRSDACPQCRRAMYSNQTPQMQEHGNHLPGLREPSNGLPRLLEPDSYPSRLQELVNVRAVRTLEDSPWSFFAPYRAEANDLWYNICTTEPDNAVLIIQMLWRLVASNPPSTSRYPPIRLHQPIIEGLSELSNRNSALVRAMIDCLGHHDSILRRSATPTHAFWKTLSMLLSHGDKFYSHELPATAAVLWVKVARMWRLHPDEDFEESIDYIHFVAVNAAMISCAHIRDPSLLTADPLEAIPYWTDSSCPSSTNRIRERYNLKSRTKHQMVRQEIKQLQTHSATPEIPVFIGLPQEAGEVERIFRMPNSTNHWETNHWETIRNELLARRPRGQ